VLDDLVVRAGLAAVAELQPLAEVALREDPALELAPLEICRSKTWNALRRG
jgi:hypothetical protein